MWECLDFYWMPPCHLGRCVYLFWKMWHPTMLPTMELFHCSWHMLSGSGLTLCASPKQWTKAFLFSALPLQELLCRQMQVVWGAKHTGLHCALSAGWHSGSRKGHPAFAKGVALLWICARAFLRGYITLAPIRVCQNRPRHCGCKILHDS